jgi:biopolymer transport protein ExbD
VNFQRGREKEPLEINLVPMIDVMLVILIFLMITTTYSKFSGMEINLPTADAPAQKQEPNEVNVVVTADGEIMVNRVPVADHAVEAISVALKRAVGDAQEPVVIINADAKATHQNVIDVMQAAQQAGLSHISFATQKAQR